MSQPRRAALGLETAEQRAEQARELVALLGGEDVEQLELAPEHEVDVALDGVVPSRCQVHVDLPRAVCARGPLHVALLFGADDLGPRVSARSFDASDPQQVAAFAEEVGAVDVLVNNAGGNTDFDSPAPRDLAEVAAAWRANLEANVITAVLTTTAVLPSMSRGGAIITIGSIAADKGAGSYGASKAAVASWNVDLAGQVGPAGITANIVSPGYIEDTEFFRDVLTDESRAQMAASAATRRAGRPEDIAATVAFLASEGARQITGQVIAVNGGERTSR